MNSIPSSRTEGLLIGTAVGDALGLPMEGLKPASIKRRGWTQKWKHRLVFGRGMWSDDTEHTIMLAQALLASEGDAERFSRKFAWELRWWLFGLPAGVGLATARAIFKLWLGFSPRKSGVFSAGNGCTMRTAVIAAYFPDDAAKRREFVRAHTRMTHSDPKAITATLAITEIAALLLKSSIPPTAEDIFTLCRDSLTQPAKDDTWLEILDSIQAGWNTNTALPKFLTSIGGNTKKGISGYVYQTVPTIIYAGVMHDWDFKKVVTTVITAGGDTDTTAAIAGALCGAYGGTNSIPQEWQHHIAEWPVSMRKLSLLAKAIHSKKTLRIRAHWSPPLLLRNLIFLAIVLTHGFARLIPRLNK